VEAALAKAMQRMDPTLRLRSGRVTGSNPFALTEAMNDLGWLEVERFNKWLIVPEIPFTSEEYWDWQEHYRRTHQLRHFFAEHGDRGPFIIETPEHFVAVSHGMACDSISRTPVPFAQWRSQRREVEGWVRFERAPPCYGDEAPPLADGAA
jgi:hypothetical protein